MSEIENKRRKVRKQGLAAAKNGTLFPRELQNVPGDRWEDAKVYSKQTRQGQNYWQDHMKSYPESYDEWAKGKQGREERERIIENKKRLGFPTKGPMAKPVESPVNQRRRKMRNAIAGGQLANNEIHGSITKQKPNVKQKQNEQNFGENDEIKRRYQRRILENAFKKK